MELGGSLVGRAPRRSRGRRDTRAALLGVASSRKATGDEKGEGGFPIRIH